MEYSIHSDCSTENMMPRILSVCTLPPSDNQWEKAVTVNCDDLPFDEPQTECINDDFIDLTMEVEEETIVDIETSDEVHEDLQEFRIKNLVENENLKQSLAAALSRGICDDISQFYHEQKNLSDVKWSQIDNLVCSEGSVAYQIESGDNTEDTSYSFVEVKAEANSRPFANIKTENIVTDPAYSFPFANIKTENSVTDPAYSSEDETALRSHKGLQSFGVLDAANTGSVLTVIKKESGGDNAEALSNLIVRNGLQYQMLNNNKVCDLLMNQQNLFSRTVPHPVCVIKSVAGRVTSVQKLRNAKRKKKQTSMTHSRKRCLVCNIRCSINENRKLPSLPFCKKCKMAYFCWLTRRCTISNYVCHSGKTCRIDYRQEKMCLKCHLAKFLTILSAAERIFKGPFRIKLSGRYSPKEACEQRKYDWSIIRDEILLQEALIFQPRVLLKRVDDCTRSTHLPSVGQAEFTKQEPLKLTNPVGQITSKSSPCLETKISVICNLLSNPPNPLRLTPAPSCRKDRKKRCSDSVSGKKLPEMPSSVGLSRPQVQHYGATSAINEGNTQLIKSDTSEAKELTSSASPGGNDFGITPHENIPSLMTPDNLSENGQNTSKPTVVGGLLKDVLNQHVAADAAVTDRLVSQYRGREIELSDFSSYSYGALRLAAKPRHPAARITKKKAAEPLKVSIFVCGHVCSLCNATKTCEWLRDHKYTKAPPLSGAVCDEIEEGIHGGTSSKKDLILKKLFDLNKLLAEDTNMSLELKHRALQHESTVPTEPLTLLNSHSARHQLQPPSHVMVHNSSEHEIPPDINRSLSNIRSVSPNNNLLGESSRLLQKLTQNAASTSQAKVHSFPHIYTGLQQSPQLPPPSLGRQSPLVAVPVTGLEHIFNTKTAQSLAVTDFRKLPELSISSEAPSPNCLSSGMKTVQSFVMPMPSAANQEQMDLIPVISGARIAFFIGHKRQVNQSCHR